MKLKILCDLCEQFTEMEILTKNIKLVQFMLGKSQHTYKTEISVLKNFLERFTVEFLFVHSLSCRITQKYMHFVFSGKKMNGQIRTPL